MAMKKLYGCNYKPMRRATVIVQGGWFPYQVGRFESRLPRMVELPDPMSSDCRYDKSLSDTGCTGCIRKTKEKA